jgi:hypothetical protein
MDAKACYALAIGLSIMASLFLGLTALASSSAAAGHAASAAIATLDAIVGLVALSAAGIFVLAGRSSAHA